MSIINQMLRELDARGASVSDAPDVPARVLVKQRDLGMPVAVGLLLAGVGAAAYWLLLEASDAPATPMPPASTVPASQNAASATRAIAPPVKTPDKPALPTIPRIQVAAPLPVDTPLAALKPEPAGQQPMVLPVQAQTESAVVKKLAELSPEAEAQQLYEDAQSLRRVGKSEAAVGKYQQALERDPGMRQARLQLAGVLQGRGQHDAALQVLKTGYEYQPNDTLAIAIGRLLADQGQRDEALNWLERGRAGLRPADFALMGALLSQIQRFEESAQAYQRALATDPEQGGWLLGLGLALESLGRLDEARTAYRKALENGDFKPEVIEFLQQKTGKPG